MNLANKITVTRIVMIPVFVMLFPIYPDEHRSDANVLCACPDCLFGLSIHKE